MEKTDHLRAGPRPSRVRVTFLFCFPPKTQHPYFLFFSCRERNLAQQRAPHPPALSVPLSLLQSLGASRSRACFSRDLFAWSLDSCTPKLSHNMGSEYWSLICSHWIKKDPTLGNQFVAEQGLWWEQLWEISCSSVQGAGTAVAINTEQGLKADQNYNLFPMCGRTWHCPLQLYEADFKITCWKKKK